MSRSRTSSVGGESEVGFRHLLIRDVAYAQIPRAARAEKHRRVAAWIEALGRPDDQAEMLAHHYVSALELARRGRPRHGRAGDSARAALRDAAERAASLYAVDAARGFYDAALRLCPEDDPERPLLLLRRSVPLPGVAVPSEDAELLSEVAVAALAAGDRATAAEAEMLSARSYFFRGDAPQSSVHMRRAEELVGDLPPTRQTVEVLDARRRQRDARRRQRALPLARDSCARSGPRARLAGRALVRPRDARVGTGQPRRP